MTPFSCCWFTVTLSWLHVTPELNSATTDVISWRLWQIQISAGKTTFTLKSWSWSGDEGYAGQLEALQELLSINMSENIDTSFDWHWLLGFFVSQPPEEWECGVMEQHRALKHSFVLSWWLNSYFVWSMCKTTCKLFLNRVCINQGSSWKHRGPVMLSLLCRHLHLARYTLHSCIHKFSLLNSLTNTFHLILSSVQVCCYFLH